MLNEPLTFTFYWSIPNPGPMDFPDVPFTVDDFHPECESGNVWYNETTLKECTGYGYDVKTESVRVQQKIVEHLSLLLQIGVSGFRVDVAFAMWDHDLKTIFDQLPDIAIGGRPFIVHELYNNKPSWTYTEFGRGIEATYGQRLTKAIRKDKNLELLGSGSGLWKPQDDHPNQFSSEDAVAFLDNHNTNFDNILYFGDTEEERLEYKLGIAFMLASDFGVKRTFSTFFGSGHPFDDGVYGSGVHFPDPREPFICGSEDDFFNSSLRNTYVCQHRWSIFRAMVTFANHVQDAPVEKIRSKSDAIAFSRGDAGFFAMGMGLEELAFNHPGVLVKNYHLLLFFVPGMFETRLPDGEYCDLVSSCLQVEIIQFHLFEVVPVVGGMVDLRGRVDKTQPIIAIVA